MSTHNNSKEVIRLTGRIIHQTAKAILFHVSTEHHKIDNPVSVSENNKTGFWFPFSQITEIHTASSELLNDGGYDELVVSKWIAKQKGIE